MENSYTRRKFLKTTAASATAAVVPSLAIAADRKQAEKSEELPKRRLGRTNRMVSCIGFGAGSRYCNWVAEDPGAHQKYIDYAIKLGITYFDSARSYGNGLAEQRYGEFLTPKYRDKIFLNSKTQ